VPAGRHRQLPARQFAISIGPRGEDTIFRACSITPAVDATYIAEGGKDASSTTSGCASLVESMAIWNVTCSPGRGTVSDVGGEDDALNTAHVARGNEFVHGRFGADSQAARASGNLVKARRLRGSRTSALGSISLQSNEIQIRSCILQLYFDA